MHNAIRTRINFYPEKTTGVSIQGGGKTHCIGRTPEAQKYVECGAQAIQAKPS
jgi:hypothetical protein